MVNSRKDYHSVVVLFIVNLINNIDRYTIAGVLPEVKSYYNINDAMAGVIQTVFLISFMIASPICGYLGDRFNRKYVMMTGMIIWLICVCASTFVPSNLFPLFLVIRSLVGIGEASYVNICPTMISDMFTTDRRTRVYMLFYLAVPVGSGLGYIVSSNVSVITGSWQWGIRITGVAGIIALFLLFFVVYEPARGAAEEVEGKKSAQRSTSYLKDIVILIKCKTYILTTIAYTTLIFVSGTLTWWMPTIIEYSIAWTRNYKDLESMPDHIKNEVGITFGLITTVAGIGGVFLGNLVAQAFYFGWLGSCMQTNRSHSIAAGIGSFITMPCLVVISLWGHVSETLTWIMVAISILGICFNWSLNVEVLNQVISPERRSTAFSYFTLISHLCGDASGPYIIGAISDAIQSNHENSAEWNYKSLAYAIFLAPIMMLISCSFYFLAAITFRKDMKKLNTEMTIQKPETNVYTLWETEDDKDTVLKI